MIRVHALFFGGVLRINQIDQLLLWENFVHLRYERTLAGVLHAKAQFMACLFHLAIMARGANVVHTGAKHLQRFPFCIVAIRHWFSVLWFFIDDYLRRRLACASISSDGELVHLYE